MSGTAQLLPSFVVANNNDTEISASISLLVERGEYTCWSDNFSNQARCLQSVEIPSPVRGQPILGRMSWFGFDQSSSGAEEPSFYHKEYCSSDSEVSSMTSTSQAGLHTALDQTLNANGELSKEPSQVQSRQDMVAQLLGQALSHRREKDERLRFFEESTDLHVILDVQGVANENPDFVMSQFNPAWTQVLGWSAEELNGKSMRGIVHPEDVSTLLAFLDTHLDDASTATKSTVTDERSFKASPFSNQHRVEHRLRTKDGAYRWISWSVAPSQKKSPLMVIGRDITSRKQAAFKLWESKRRLQESQDIARLGHWELDLVENVLQWSDEIYRLFQVDRHKFGASYEAFLNAIHPDDRDAVNDAYTMSLKTKKPYSIIHRLRYADGGIRWVRELCRTGKTLNVCFFLICCLSHHICPACQSCRI